MSNQIKHTGTYLDSTKHTGVATNVSKVGVGQDTFLLMEDGDFLLQQNGDRLMITRRIHWDNQLKSI